MLIAFWIRIGAISSAIALLTAVEASPKSVDADQKQTLIKAIEKRLERRAYAFSTDFSQWPEFVGKHKEAIHAAGTEAELATALNAALGEFDLSHLALRSPKGGALARKGKRLGIGVSLRRVEQGIFITHTIKGSPAWKAGIRKGDTLTHIDGELLTDVSQLKGTLGQVRSISWIRDERNCESELRYEAFAISERSSMQWLSSEIALIRIHSFQYGFYNAARINRFFREAKNAQGIVIDLRNNRGGLSFYSRHLASKIANGKTVFGRRAKRRHQRPVGRKDASLEELAEHARDIRPLPFSCRPYEGKVVVLVDALSASAADIFPAFAQENGLATIVGERTSGALLLARTFRLPGRFQLYAPIAEILTPEGRRLENAGLEPDVKLSFEDASNDDLIYALAKELIEQ